MPTVAGFTTTPVKSMALSRPDHIELSESGCVGDRRFLCCRGDGQRLSGISKAALMPIRPVYDADAERLTLVFPDGAAGEGDATDVGQPVTVGLFDRDSRRGSSRDRSPMPSGHTRRTTRCRSHAWS